MRGSGRAGMGTHMAHTGPWLGGHTTHADRTGAKSRSARALRCGNGGAGSPHRGKSAVPAEPEGRTGIHAYRQPAAPDAAADVLLMPLIKVAPEVAVELLASAAIYKCRQLHLIQ